MATTITAGNATNGLAFSADNTGAFEFKTGTGAGTTAMSISATGNVSGVIKSGTAVASTSGTSIDFTGIPSTAKRITVMFNGVSTNGGSNYQIQIGSGSVTTTGYVSNSVTAGSTNSVIAVTATTGFVSFNNAAANIYTGIYFLTLISGNTWILSGTLATTNSTYIVSSAGNSPALSGVLDRVRITTVNGTDTFDAGSVNILYE